MKIFSIPAFGACIFLIFFLASAGCAGIAEQGPDPNCTRPFLIFNDSQEVTRIYDISYTSPFEPVEARPGRVPLGGVVYRSSGFTRIFDATGKQILRVNDAESVNPTPGGIRLLHAYRVRYPV